MSWTAHDLLLLDWDRCGTYAGTQQAMNTALGSVLRAFEYPVIPHRYAPPGIDTDVPIRECCKLQNNFLCN